jgi:lysozyme family protein
MESIFPLLAAHYQILPTRTLAGRQPSAYRPPDDRHTGDRAMNADGHLDTYTRRSMIALGAVTLAAIMVGSLVGPAAAQDAASSAEASVSALEAKSRTLGVSGRPPLSATNDPEKGNFRKLKARLLQLIEEGEKKGENGEQIAREADELLAKLHKIEQAKRRSSLGALRDNIPLLGGAKAPKFNDALRTEYRDLFDSCQLRPKYKDDIALDLKIIRKAENKVRYKDVEQKTSVPWYFVGIAHSLECSSRFRAHLHNGDDLTKRTWQVPANRPKIWLPPSDWASSAVDALAYEADLQKKVWGPATDWSLERMLLRFEIYNGFGTRAKGIHSPYLWSFSQHYTKGKYVHDHDWDPNAVSEQSGAAVILHELVKSGEITRPKNWTA